MCVRKSQRLCFLDSDNLTNLDELFDIVPWGRHDTLSMTWMVVCVKLG